MKLSNRHISHLFLSTISIALLTFFFTPVKSYAASVSLGIYPPIIKIKTAPNSHVQQRVTISNYGSAPTIVSIGLKMFKPSEKKDGEIIFLPNTNKAKNFFSERIRVLDGSIPVNQVLLAPQQHKSLTIDINIPKDQQEADYYISILFISNSTEQTKSNAALLSEGVATNILLAILPQPAADTGYIKDFIGPKLIDKDTIPFSVEVANQGIHFFNAKGQITITNMLFNSKDIIPLQQEIILAHSSRYMTNAAEVSLSKVLWNHGFLFGVYRADLAVSIGSSKVPFHKILYFYSYPVVGFAIALIVIIFSATVGFRISKKRT